MRAPPVPFRSLPGLLQFPAQRRSSVLASAGALILVVTLTLGWAPLLGLAETTTPGASGLSQTSLGTIPHSVGWAMGVHWGHPHPIAPASRFSPSSWTNVSSMWLNGTNGSFSASLQLLLNTTYPYTYGGHSLSGRFWAGPAPVLGSLDVDFGDGTSHSPGGFSLPTNSSNLTFGHIYNNYPVWNDFPFVALVTNSSGASITLSGTIVFASPTVFPPDPFCSPVPGNVTVGVFGLNFSVATTPANGSGPSPMNFSWNLSVHGGGLPPYRTILYLSSAIYAFNSTNRTGNLTITGAGIYQVDVMAEDSSCTQTSYTSFPLQVWGPLGPNPVTVSYTTNSSVVPALVTYSVNVSNLPANSSVYWTTPGLFSAPTLTGRTNFTYFFPGTYRATACYVNDSFVYLACGTSPNVTIGGASPIASLVTISPGPYPVNITYSVNVTRPTILPNGTQLYLFARNGDLSGQWVETNNSSVSLTVSGAGCGYPWTTYVPPTGICPRDAVFSFIGPVGGPDNGILGITLITANLTANGTPSLWYPTVSYSYGPLNGTLPLNFTLNFSASNGIAPYTYSYSVLGRTSGAANATFFSPIGALGYGWNGSLISLVIPLNATGVYWIQVFISDVANDWVSFDLPLIVLGNVSAFFPLVVHASVSGPATGALTTGTYARFTATTDGGRGPYTVQWAFGDGQFSSSIPGAPVYHRYLDSGSFSPTVTVTDSSGQSVVSTLPVVVVAPLPDTGQTRPAQPTPSVGGTHFTLAWPPVLFATLAAAALMTAGAIGVRREFRHEGEALIADLEPATDPISPLDPPG